jgi:hypothetical protein
MTEREARKQSGSVILVSIRPKYLKDKFAGEEIEYRRRPCMKPVRWMIIHESGVGVCAVAKVDAVLKPGEIPGSPLGGYHMRSLHRIPRRPYLDFSTCAPQNYHMLSLTDDECEALVSEATETVNFRSIEEWRKENGQ